jgi:hypothetical protein
LQNAKRFPIGSAECESQVAGDSVRGGQNNHKRWKKWESNPDIKTILPGTMIARLGLLSQEDQKMNAIVMSVVKDHPSAATAAVGSSIIDTATDQMTMPVPLKPSAAMLAAGSRSGGVSVEIAWKIYLAMIREAA